MRAHQRVVESTRVLIACLITSTITMGVRASTLTVEPVRDPHATRLASTATSRTHLDLIAAAATAVGVERDAERNAELAADLSSPLMDAHRAAVRVVVTGGSMPFGHLDESPPLALGWNGLGRLHLAARSDEARSDEERAFVFDVISVRLGAINGEAFLGGGLSAGAAGRFDQVPATMIPLPAPLALGVIGLVGVFCGARRLRRHAAR